MTVANALASNIATDANSTYLANKGERVERKLSEKREAAPPVPAPGTTPNSGAGLGSPNGFAHAAVPFKPASKEFLPSDKAIWQDYIRMQQIGQGMSGQVWRTYHRSSRSFHALKVMEKETFKPHFMHHVLQMEMTLQAAMDHPYIVKVEHVFETPQMVVLVMPFMANGDLTHAFRTRPSHRFGEAIVRFWTAQVVSALTYLHRHSIIYGDMKPDNVLLDDQNFAHLTDFGLARWVPSGQHLGRQGFGMPNSYLSPEMIKGEPYGCEADLWAVGVLMYLMALGRHPFINPGDSMTDCEAIHTRMIGPDPPTFSPNVISSAGEDFFLQLLQKPTSVRMKTVDQVKAHRWFRGFDWAALESKQLKSPDPGAGL